MEPGTALTLTLTLTLTLIVECMEPGTAVVGVPCNASDTTQHGWAYDATAKHITHSTTLCLSAQAWGLPLNLYECGNATAYQSYTYDATSKHFMTTAPANDPNQAYPALLEVVAGDGIQKVYGHRPIHSSIN